MSFDVVPFTLAAAVADSGTVTVGYPDGKSRGNYLGQTGKHVLIVGQNKFSAPADFTLTFNANASSITVTNASGASWANGSACYLQLERAGPDDKDMRPSPKNVRAVEMREMFLDLGSPNVADSDGIAASQSVTIATTPLAVINGAYAVSGEAIADVPRNVVAGWTGAAVLTITGEDEYGQEMTEVSASGVAHTGLKAFKKVTAASFSANVTGATIGFGDVLGLPIAVLNASQVVGEVYNGAIQSYPTGRVCLFGKILEANVDTPAPLNLVSPVAGVIRKVSVIAAGTVTTGGDFTVEVDTTAVDGLTITVANGAVEGEVDSDVPTYGHASTAVAVGSRIEIIPSSGFSGAADFEIVVEIDAAPALRGTLVAAVVTEPTSTSGDVRGTYDPLEACNGDKAFGLIVRVADPANLGLTQYAA